MKDFGKDFVWGCATAAFQIEGAAHENGKGASVWDMMCRIPGKVKNGDNGEVACDHFHRYKEDIGMMKEMGIPAYRFSVSWPRVIPTGVGQVSEAGLDFYDRLVDELIGANITPYVTLFHWDFPYDLFIRGGWLNPDSSKWFADYTQVVVDRIGDRVKHWMTHNEPQCFLGIGHRMGKHAPGLELDWPEFLLATHNALLAHGRSVQVLRNKLGKSAEIGWAVVGNGTIPSVETPVAIEAARSAMFEVKEKSFWPISWYLDPVVFGKYPEDGLKVFEKDMPNFDPDDLKIISQDIDYIGLNIYNSDTVSPTEDGGWVKDKPIVGLPLTKFNCPVTPEALYWSPKFIYERYNKPIIISENGCSCHDWVSMDGKVHDPSRIDFLHRYLNNYKRASLEGVDTKAYFQWSLMDNFEWSEGYCERFGLIHVDFQTGKRTLKDSAYWYRDVIANNGADI